MMQDMLDFQRAELVDGQLLREAVLASACRSDRWARKDRARAVKRGQSQLSQQAGEFESMIVATRQVLSSDLKVRHESLIGP